MYTDLELAYFAGIVDGEGCFFIGLYNTKGIRNAKGCPNYQSFIKVSNTDKELIDWIKERFEGTNNTITRRSRVNQFERDIYSIQIGGPTMDALLPDLYPLLVIKRKHCEVMMRFRTTFEEGKRLGKRVTHKDTHELRYACFIELRHLNSRYRNHPAKQPYSLRPCCPEVIKPPGVPSQLE